MKVKRLFIVLAAVKNAQPYAIVTREVMSTTGIYNNIRAVQRDLDSLYAMGFIYCAARGSHTQKYWALTNSGKAYFGLPVEKEQAA